VARLVHVTSQQISISWFSSVPETAERVGTAVTRLLSFREVLASNLRRDKTVVN
jgi:hypothetical protein